MIIAVLFVYRCAYNLLRYHLNKNKFLERISMHAQEPFTVTLESLPLEYWDAERALSPLRTLAVRLHSAGISLHEPAAAFEQFGVARSHQAVFQWIRHTAETAPDPPMATPSRIAVDETAVTIGTEQY